MLILNQYMGNNSCSTDAILTKLNMHQSIMVICSHNKFHQIPLIGYVVMAPDGRDRQMGGENYIPHPLPGDNN